MHPKHAVISKGEPLPSSLLGAPLSPAAMWGSINRTYSNLWLQCQQFSCIVGDVGAMELSWDRSNINFTQLSFPFWIFIWTSSSSSSSSTSLLHSLHGTVMFTGRGACDLLIATRTGACLWMPNKFHMAGLQIALLLGAEAAESRTVAVVYVRNPISWSDFFQEICSSWRQRYIYI